MTGPKLEVVKTIYESNFRDVSATLRAIADEIEAGKYGPANDCAVVLMENRLEIFGAGQKNDAGSVALLLHAASMKLCQPIVDHGL